MTSLSRLKANRDNALKSTGPRTHGDKERSRCNAVRHGLTAETVIARLEDADDYQAFEAAVIADYEAESAVERELVLRLASVLWRLRRANAVETVLFGMDMDELSNGRRAVSGDVGGLAAPEDKIIPLPGAHGVCPVQPREQDRYGSAGQENGFVSSNQEIARAYLRLTELPTYPLDRLSRYEHTLWRQAREIMLTLDGICGRSRARRRFRFPFAREP
jgi:hypothetical protein